MSYAEDPSVVKRAAGFNFLPLADARAMHERLLAWYEGGAVRSVIGGTIDFAEVPRGLEVLERREVLGRMIVQMASGS